MFMSYILQSAHKERSCREERGVVTVVIGNKATALHYGTESSTSEDTGIAGSTHRTLAVMFAGKYYD